MLEKDILRAIDMIKSSTIFREKYDEMKEYSRIYQNTTENIKSYMPYLKGNYQSALLPTASGDHQLEAILDGINEITCFDINRLAKYFVELKFCAIKNLLKDEFIYFMYEDMLNKDVFDYIKDSLNEDIRIFWEELYKKYSIDTIRSGLFRHLGVVDGKLIKGNDFYKYCVDNFTRYTNEDNYKLLQDRLENVNIKYMDANLLSLAKNLNKKYDLINLTNIYEHVNHDIFTDGDIDFANALEKIIPYLNEDGKLLVTYLYKCSLKDVKKYKKKSLRYAKILCELQNTTLGANYDKFAEKNDKKRIEDRLYYFRNMQLMKHIESLDINLHEVPAVGHGCGQGDKDLVLVYEKKKSLTKKISDFFMEATITYPCFLVISIFKYLFFIHQFFYLHKNLQSIKESYQYFYY